VGAHVFVCYAREDKEFVLKLAAHLKTRGIPVWLDQWDIPFGENWSRTIDEAIITSAQFLIVLSPAAVDSSEVEGEWHTALDEKKPIIPVLYQTCSIPRQLRLRQYIDFTTRSPEDATTLDQVVHALSGGQHPSPPQELSPAPQQSKRRIWLLRSLLVGFIVLFSLYLLRTYLDSPPRMVSISAGEFWRGCSEGDKECDDTEQPGRKVTLAAFSIDKYEVTVVDYRECVKAGKCSQQGMKVDEACNWDKSREDHPINCVDWGQAAAYCQWAGKRLPTEAEWEKAARAGSATAYSFGNGSTGLGEYAWYAANSGGGTHPVGQRKPNAWGLYDMHGNVWEWMQDYYARDYYQQSPAQDPKGPTSGNTRVLRGGAWSSKSEALRVSSRAGFQPGHHYIDFGFRCAWSVK
jgi:formylglycine-generating enzyme required for sulfatase activity